MPVSGPADVSSLRQLHIFAATHQRSTASMRHNYLIATDAAYVLLIFRLNRHLALLFRGNRNLWKTV